MVDGSDIFREVSKRLHPSERCRCETPAPHSIPLFGGIECERCGRLMISGTPSE